MRRDDRSASGFSLIELMVAVAVLGVITAQLFVVFGNQKKVYASNERALETQEQARLTLDLISFDTRMAGFMVPRWTAVSSVDGDTTDADRFCVSDASYFNFTASPSPLDSRTRPFDGAQVVNLSDSQVQLATLDIDGDGSAVDFLAPTAGGNGGGIIIATPTETYCARITQIQGTTIDFADHPGATAALPSGVGPQLRAVPAHVYELDQNALELRRNGLLLASSIEDFQIEYWLDNAGLPNGTQDGDTEFPINDLRVPDPPGGGIPANNAQIRRVRVSVLARAEREEDQVATAHGNLAGARPAMGNRDASNVPDRFRRHSFSASILPRNLVAVGDT
jgi:prepilin-type N-terminal cleavage/methylation domain-containing protein